MNLYRYLINDRKEFVIAKQLLRSGTSIGAMIREAEFAQIKKDFIHKMSIAQKEANETQYWLELLYKTEYIDVTQFESINEDVIELLRLLTASVKTAKKNINH